MTKPTESNPNKPATPPGQDPNRIPPGQDPNRMPPGQNPDGTPGQQKPRPNQDLPDETDGSTSQR